MNQKTGRGVLCNTRGSAFRLHKTSEAASGEHGVAFTGKSVEITVE